jgi:SAM-dependent methyltransferase
MTPDQRELDARNTAFWDELCGSSLARQLGITRRDEEGLRQFDSAYFGLYPYLESYVPERLEGRSVLEIGLGYGTLSELLIQRGADFYGLDIAEHPVSLVAERLRRHGVDPDARVTQGSALAIPFPDNFFDAVFTIGCLHHTGDIAGSVSEVNRVLRPGGTAVVMLYNRHSFRQLVTVRLARARHRLARARRRSFDEQVRAMYDTNEAGEAAPHIDYTSVREARRIFTRFRSVSIDKQNADPLVLFGGRVVLLRERLLNNLGRVLGLDLYITAVK